MLLQKDCKVTKTMANIKMGQKVIVAGCITKCGLGRLENEKSQPSNGLAGFFRFQVRDIISGVIPPVV